ncbi:MAG TPA: dienelactone hydrolase family protein, partial [Planctomycetaceae bacterium]|nr:dienelactone hydrolase family protein [Planctomycetaceae bacterium]
MPAVRVAALLLVGTALLGGTARGEDGPLPGTQLLTGPDDLSVLMMDGLHRFVERKVADAPAGRGVWWKRDFTSPEAYAVSIEANRQRLRHILGVVDERVPARMERCGDKEHPELVAETSRYRVYQVRWTVLDGVTGEGLWLEPKSPARAVVIAIPDADQTPEQLAGILPGVPEKSQYPRQLANNGIGVLIPVLIDRTDEWSGHPEVAFTNQPHREWIYRQAYHMGRHVIGYEVQKVLAAIAWLQRESADKRPIGVSGYGEGGLIALATAALEPRVQACLVSGYFEPHAHPWEEPLYRNVFGFYREFGDAELVSLVAPRGVVIEHSSFPQADSPLPVKAGRKPGAALGRLTTPKFEAVKAEFDRIATLVPDKFQPRELIAGAEGATIDFGSTKAVGAVAKMLGVELKESTGDMPKVHGIPDVRARQHRQVTELERHVQRLVRGSDAIRRK